METSKRVIVEASAPFSLASVQREDAVMHAVRTSLPTVYFHTLGGLPLYAQTKTPSSQDTLPFALPASQSSSRQALSLLTLHVPSGMHLQQPGQKAGVPAPATRAKSAGKHMCPYCGRDCLKPSVLEKHLRCHTGERPYPCTTCGVAFKTQSNLYKHKRTQAHARLSSSDSERDSLSSQESVPGSRATCWSTSSLEGQSEGSSSFEKDISVPASSSSASADVIQVPPAHGHVGPDTGWLLQKSAAAGLLLTSVNGKQDAHSAVGRDSVPNMIQKQQKGEQGEKAGPSIPPRHLSLQRQEATFFSKQWDSHTSGGKSQNHDSTDSGFSESSEQLSNPSPGGTLHDHSMESLAESSVEDQEELRAPQRLTDTEVTVTKGSKNRVSLLEKRKLEERICRLISENDALVDDKTLENVRPRKTLPSKQGSIDLPMPYTYKDSFHFEMKTSRQSLFSSDWQNSEKQVKQALYSSVPTQRSVSLEHAPLVRSSSLPFNMGSSGFERSHVAGSYQTEGTQQSGRDRTEHGHPSDLLMRSMEQPTSHPRSLVRQKAVDCIPAAELLNLTSCTEENYSSGPSGEGTSADPTGESSGGKCRRKKLPKFSYNKWYMYGDGAFRKLCNIEKGLARNTFRAKKAVNSMEQEKEQEIPIKSTVTFREPQSSGISTQDLRLDASDVNSACNPSQLPPHLPPSGRASLEQATNNPDAPNAFFQKLILKNLTDSTQQSVTKQSNIQAISNKTDRATKALDLEEQNAGPPTSSSQGENLPSERKKQRTDDSMGVLLEKEGVGSQEEDNTMLRQNRWLPLMREHTTQKYASITEQNNTVKLKDKVMALRTCPADHPLDQKLIQLKEYASSSSQETTCRTSALTKSSFLPKYQLKLPQSTDSMTSTSRLSSDTAERLPSTPHPQITEKHLPPTTLTMAEAQTSTPDLASVDTCAERPTAICVDSQSLLTPSGMKPSVMANHSVAIVTSISAHSEASSPSSSSQIPQYKGKLTLLNSPTPIAADDNGHDRNQAGDVQVFLQIVSGEQLSVTEYQKESKQEVDSSKGILQEESKFADSPVGISAARKPQELICHEVQPPPRVAQKTTKPETALGGTSGKASGTPLPCSSSEWDATLHTEQHRGTDEFSQQSSVHSKTAVEPVRSARRENFEKSQNEAHSDSNLEEPDAADLETFMQKQGGSAGYGDALLLKPPLSSFQEDAGQMHNVSSETCAAAKPAASLTEIPEAAERLTVSLLEAPPPPAPVSVPADWKVRPRSPCSLKSSCLAVHQQSHIKAPQKALTCNNVSSSSGRSSPSPAAVQQQHKLMEMASVLQKTSASVITPSQLTSNKKSSLSPCQEQKIFTCEPQHPSLPPHTSLSMILPSDQSPGLEDFDMARRKGTTDTEQTSQIPTDSSPSSSETMSLIPVTADVYQRNGQPMQCKEKKIFLFDKVSPEKHDTFRKEAPNSAEPQVADICCDASLLGEKANLGSQVHIPLSSNERLKVLRHKDTETGSSAPAPLDVSPAQGNRTDRDIKNVFSCAVSVGMLPQASSNTLPAFDQQATDSGALRFQHKPTRTPSLHSSPPATTETSSRGLLVHMVSQHDKRTQGFAFRMGKLNSECENDGAVPSQTHPGHLAQAGKMLDASRANLGQYGAASPFSLSNASLNKNKLYPDSVTTTPGSLLPDKSKSTAAALVTSDAHCQPIPGSLDSQLHHATGTGLRTRSLATNTGDGSQDESTAPHDKPEAGQREAAASCYTSGTQPDAQSTGGLAHLCGISHPAAGHPHGGQPSCGGPQEERNAWSDGQPGGGEEGEQDGGDPGVTPSLGRDKGGFTEVVGVERDAGGEEAKIDDALRQRGSPSHLRAVIGLQMSVQDTTILKGQLQLQSMAKEVTTSYSERCRLHVRQLPVQSGATLSPTFPSSLTENFALKGETGSSLPSSSRNPIPGQLTSGTSLLSAIQSPDQGEVHHQRKLRQPEKMKRGQQSLPHLSSSSSSILLEHPLLAEAAQLAGEAETPAGSIEGRSSTSHSLKRGLLSLNEGIQHEGSASGVPRTSARDDPSSASQRSTQNVGRVPTWPEFSGFVPSRPASSRPQLIRSQTSPAFCLVPPGGSVKGQGRAEESPVKVGVSSQEEAVDSSSSDDEGKLVIELE